MVRRVNVLFNNVERENDAGGFTQEQSTPNRIVSNSVILNLKAMFEEFSNVFSERAGMKSHGWWSRRTRVVKSGKRRGSFSFLASLKNVPVQEAADQKIEALPKSNSATNWTINVSDVRTVKVSNISLTATDGDIKEFFSFSGDVLYVEMRRESETTQLAYVTFKESQGADTAMLLSGATVADLSVSITPVEDYQLPPEALSSKLDQKPPVTDSAVKKAEDVVSTMLAKGFVLGKDALNKARAFDERIHLSSNASATVASIGHKIGLSEKLSVGTAVVNEKVREMDEKFHVLVKTKSALSAAEQKASSVGSAIMSNPYVSTGASWVSGALTAVAKAAEDVSVMTREKVEKAEEEKMAIPVSERTSAHIHHDRSPAGEPPMLPNDPADSKLANI
ncbi:unnamed protein product [Dovyalis caffra]|uniref:RRM domain-containing protein n=1 Tax=Dovyalis caffra TaxID=77055 RepID=A0AAV1R0K1_9ROSI|nr:unnamed protein product [Dovyalis caffra]